ncbi:heterogeneous nuclear ribonucleoprotein 27C-like isoform X2 [Centropristis striata]|uniref:heterogeneous nuclear ribonucleoprotein 27C-like isoform X2 n=1 Tax=Centropristis striata TaxID=184440 RepID=UPI0027DF1CD6|nr:heterogeneous nuclear ribonucleoprotein 27C-like isoform X2 [Centropristis striata]
MVSLRISWICVLLFSSAYCFPKPEDYTAPRGFSGDAAPRTSPLFPGSQAALMDQQYGQSAGYQQPSQQPGAPTGNQSPSGVGGPSVVLGTSPTYDPSGYVSPPRPANTGSSFVKPQAAGTSGQSNVGSGGAASGPVHTVPAWAPAAPAWAGYGAYANTNTGPATYYTADTSSYGSYDAAPETSSYGSYYAAPETSSYGSDSAPGLPWVEQPIETSFSDPSNWLPRGDFPDFSVWGSNANSKMSKTAESEEETSPIPSSTYIIQSGNGYLRGLEYRSHTNYAPEDPEPLVFVAEPVRAPRPAAPSKGGKKY